MTSCTKLRGRLDVRLDARREAWLRDRADKDARNVSSFLSYIIDKAMEAERQNEIPNTERLCG